MFSTICAFTPNRAEVFRYDGNPGDWTKIGGEKGQLYGGGFGLFGTLTKAVDSFQVGHLFRWQRRMHELVAHAWRPIGFPGADFAVTADTIYGLTPNRGAVFRYNNSP